MSARKVLFREFCWAQLTRASSAASSRAAIHRSTSVATDGVSAAAPPTPHGALVRAPAAFQQAFWLLN